ncbi:TlyA family RNA methyltransferase [Herbiconiux sp. KACC 21604]|uniref:TlyA family RNA methyltransferase n=1 Tax=unclassified Herbiconiux TaxID=2618217 RepID=UPI0014918FCB|nr:TlyA family RNA methyltransferase [Herbiconiux sp. SALV-R1]QJU53068.1 TlyA family RNA methyltransferase [Herbiconiux sp. SALV-R1]WPO88004.1 TlyA family RNA methyltransferase [Herbiconiux sp. KACC 21604]
MPEARLDAAVAALGLARSRTHAARLIANGYVRVDGEPVVKASFPVREGQLVSVDAVDRYVSRGANKLIAALDAFDGVRVDGRLALDAGASTGGFTQVLLERGARQVIAADVGHGQLDPIVARDERVVQVEGFNLRYATPETLAGASGVQEAPELVVADLSFIPLALVLPALKAVATPEADFVLLVKPQFEVGRTGVKEGIVRDPALRADAVASVLWAAFDLGLSTAGLIRSPIAGNAGNLEYLVWLDRRVGTHPTEWLERVTEMTGA